MPGIATHVLMADLAADSHTGPDGAALRDVIDSHRAIYRLGAVGPDLAFFAPDFGDAAVTFVRRLATMYDQLIGPLVELYETHVEPIVDAIETVEEGVEAVLDELTCGLVGDVKAQADQVASRIDAIVQQGLGSVVIEAVDVFDLMTPPIQDGQKIESWFWFDTLHNRRSGRFIDELWTHADTDEQRAYVLGYASHYAGDLVGHQFVNTVVGSPARARLQRHHLAENMIDTKIFDTIRDAEVSGAKIHLLLPHGQVVEDSPSLAELVDQLNEMPPDLAPIFTMISEAMEAAFKDVPHPRRISSEYLSPDHLNQAFWLMLTSMRASTSAFIPPPQPPSLEAVSTAVDAIADLLETAKNPPRPPSSPPDGCLALWREDCDVSLPSVSDWADAMSDALDYLAEVVMWAGQLIKDLFDVMACTITAPIKVALQSGFYLLHSALHAALERVREVLVQSSIVYPTRQFVRTHPMAKSFLTITASQVADSRSGTYPHRASASNEGFQRYPETATELPATWSSSFGVGTRAEQIVSDFPVQFSSLEALGNSDDPAESRQFAVELSGTPLGSVVPMTADIQKRIWTGNGAGIPDLNLDADRGWGHRNWLIDAGGEGSVRHDSTDPVRYDWSE